jgi:hypothetical protein
MTVTLGMPAKRHTPRNTTSPNEKKNDGKKDSKKNENKSDVKKLLVNADAMKPKWNVGKRRKNTNASSAKHTSNSNPSRLLNRQRASYLTLELSDRRSAANDYRTRNNRDRRSSCSLQ